MHLDPFGDRASTPDGAVLILGRACFPFFSIFCILQLLGIISPSSSICQKHLGESPRLPKLPVVKDVFGYSQELSHALTFKSFPLLEFSVDVWRCLVDKCQVHSRLIFPCLWVQRHIDVVGFHQRFEKCPWTTVITSLPCIACPILDKLLGLLAASRGPLIRTWR